MSLLPIFYKDYIVSELQSTSKKVRKTAFKPHSEIKI